MEWLQTLLDSSTTPAVTALLLGLLTALSPCPLATNIAAVGYIAKHIDSGRSVFVKGLLYTLGRMLAYTLLGVVLIAVLRSGASVFGIRKFVAVYGEMLLGPVLVVAGLYMLFGSRLNLPSFGFGGSGERIARRGNAGALLLGVLFAMAFCPTSGVFYFGMLIPLSATTPMGYLLPVLYAVATSLPVLAVAWTLAFSAGRIGKVYSSMKALQKWLNLVVGIMFMVIGVYFCIIFYF